MLFFFWLRHVRSPLDTWNSPLDKLWTLHRYRYWVSGRFVLKFNNSGQLGGPHCKSSFSVNNN